MLLLKWWTNVPPGHMTALQMLLVYLWKGRTTVSATLDLKETAGFVLVCVVSFLGISFKTVNHWLKFVTRQPLTQKVQLVFLAEKQGRGILPYYMGSCVSGQDDPNSCAVIGYPSSGLPALSRKNNNVLFPYSRSSFEQACSGKMAEYWARSFSANLPNYCWTRCYHFRGTKGYHSNSMSC